eukprot:COSAG02_NODE_1266_length_13539_cov_216.818824_10_plen_118_part_00
MPSKRQRQAPPRGEDVGSRLAATLIKKDSAKLRECVGSRGPRRIVSLLIPSRRSISGSTPRRNENYETPALCCRCCRDPLVWTSGLLTPVVCVRRWCARFNIKTGNTSRETLAAGVT